MNGYRLTVPAKQDLEEIFEWTEKHYGLTQAVAYLSEFETLFKQLAENPRLGKTRPEIRKGLRSIPMRKHVAFYRVKHGHVVILRIFHGFRDLGESMK